MSLVLTKDHNLCTMLQTAFMTGWQGKSRVKKAEIALI